MTPWMGALTDNIEVLTHSEEGGEWGRAATNDLLANRIKVRSMSFMRGRTFLNRYVIIDEAQNITPKQMKALITRAGPGVFRFHVKEDYLPSLADVAVGDWITYGFNKATLPAAEKAAKDKSASIYAQIAANRVADGRQTLEGLELVLTARGFEVILAAGGRDRAERSGDTVGLVECRDDGRRGLEIVGAVRLGDDRRRHPLLQADDQGPAHGGARHRLRHQRRPWWSALGARRASWRPRWPTATQDSTSAPRGAAGSRPTTFSPPSTSAWTRRSWPSHRSSRIRLRRRRLCPCRSTASTTTTRPACWYPLVTPLPWERQSPIY